MKENETSQVTQEQPTTGVEIIAFLEDLANEVLGALGAGHTESVYHRAMEVGLQDRGVSYESERDITIMFRGRYVGTVRADLIINKQVVVELKQAVAGSDTIVSDAREQCRCYMRETQTNAGVVIVFPKRDSGKISFTCFSTTDAE